MKEVTITERHLDKAIAERPQKYDPHYSITEQCVFSQAVREAGMPDAKTSGAGVFIPDGVTPLLTPVAEQQGVVRKLVSAFDAHRYDEVRSMLPLTIQLEAPSVEHTER